MIVIKLGGNALAASSNNDWIDAIQGAFKNDPRIIIVHGGGPQIDDELAIHGQSKVVIDGYRVTDSKAFEIVEMVLAGRVQQSLVRTLRGAKIPAVGVSGSDGALFDVTKKFSPSGKDLGQVGEVIRVNKDVLEALLDRGFLPVVSSVSSDENGLGFNVNADLAAGALAGAFHAKRAIFMTDVPGIYRNFPDEDSLMAKTSVSELRQMLPSLASGMIPKVEAVITALELGAECASVIDGRDGKALLTLLAEGAVGTEVIHG